MKHLIVTRPNPLTPWENHYLVIVSYLRLSVLRLTVVVFCILCTCLTTPNIHAGPADLTLG